MIDDPIYITAEIAKIVSIVAAILATCLVLVELAKSFGVKNNK